MFQSPCSNCISSSLMEIGLNYCASHGSMHFANPQISPCCSSACTCHAALPRLPGPCRTRTSALPCCTPCTPASDFPIFLKLIMSAIILVYCDSKSAAEMQLQKSCSRKCKLQSLFSPWCRHQSPRLHSHSCIVRYACVQSVHHLAQTTAGTAPIPPAGSVSTAAPATPAVRNQYVAG